MIDNKNEFICLYTGEDSEAFEFCRILAEDDENMIIQNITPTGTYDGLTLIKHEDISWIERDNKYVKRMKKLVEHRGTVLPEYSFKSDNLLKEFLELALAEKEIIGVSVRNADVYVATGFLKSFDDNRLIVEEIDFYGEPDGETVVPLINVDKIIYAEEEISTRKICMKKK